MPDAGFRPIFRKKIILLHLQASGLNTSNVGFGLVFTIEFKLQAFNSEIGSLKTNLKKKKKSDYEIEIYLSSELPGFELSDFVIVRALVLQYTFNIFLENPTELRADNVL